MRIERVPSPSRRRLLACAIVLFARPAQAGDLFVIANELAGMSAEEVKEVFLGEVQFAGSLKLLPVDNAGAQPDFQARVLRMSSSQYNASWTKKAFRDGLNPPPLKASDAEVIGFVKNHPGAIGYVSTPPADVRVIARF